MKWPRPGAGLEEGLGEGLEEGAWPGSGAKAFSSA